MDSVRVQCIAVGGEERKRGKLMKVDRVARIEYAVKLTRSPGCVEY